MFCHTVTLLRDILSDDRRVSACQTCTYGTVCRHCAQGSSVLECTTLTHCKALPHITSRKQLSNWQPILPLRVHFYTTFADFLKRDSCCDVLRLLLVIAMCKWSMEQLWDDTDRGKLKYCEQNLSLCRFVHRKSHIDRHEMELGPSRLKAGD